MITERPLAQAQLLAVAPRGHVVELAVVVALRQESVTILVLSLFTDDY